jgi:hypothetical protein
MVREPRKKKKGALESENARNLPLDLTRSYLAIPYDVSRHQVVGAYFFDGFFDKSAFSDGVFKEGIDSKSGCDRGTDQ